MSEEQSSSDRRGVALWRAITRQRRSLRSIVAVLSGSAGAVLLNAVGGVLVARFVAPEVAGAFRYYTIPLMYLAHLQLGTFDGVTRQIPFYIGKGRPDLVEGVAASAGAWNLLLSGVLSAGFLLVAVWSFVQGDARGALGWGAQAFVAWWSFYGLFLWATYRTVDHFVSVARIQVSQALLSLALVFTLPVFGFGGLCIRAAVPSVVGAWLLHVARPLRVAPVIKRERFTEVIRIGLPFFIWSSLYGSLWGAVENTMVLTLGGKRWLGLFTVAVMLREGTAILPQAVYQVLTPRIVEAYGREGRLGQAFTFMYRLVPPLTAGMAVVVLVLGYALDVLVPAYLPNYADGLGLMKIAMWFGVVQMAALPLNGLFVSGKGRAYGRGVLAALIAFPIVTLLVASWTGGVMAVAVGSLTGKIVRTIIGYWDLRSLAMEESRASEVSVS